MRYIHVAHPLSNARCPLCESALLGAWNPGKVSLPGLSRQVLSTGWILILLQIKS